MTSYCFVPHLSRVYRILDLAVRRVRVGFSSLSFILFLIRPPYPSPWSFISQSPRRIFQPIFSSTAAPDFLLSVPRARRSSVFILMTTGNTFLIARSPPVMDPSGCDTLALAHLSRRRSLPAASDRRCFLQSAAIHAREYYRHCRIPNSFPCLLFLPRFRPTRRNWFPTTIGSLRATPDA